MNATHDALIDYADRYTRRAQEHLDAGRAQYAQELLTDAQDALTDAATLIDA